MNQLAFRKVGRLTAVIALGVWAVWWSIALVQLELPLIRWTNILPCFGCDFTTQTDFAARTWSGMVDPYTNHRHLFHYPPIVIRLFAWTPYLSTEEALRIWIVVLALLMVAGTVVACKTRQELRLKELPLPIALGCVLFSFPALFALERANFDLIALAAILLALPLDKRGGWAAEIAAGCLLAVAPWVKIYPGLIGVGLLALRRHRVFAGFVGAGIAIGLAAPAETLRSLEVLGMAMDRVRETEFRAPAWPWNHSLAITWLHVAETAARNGVPLLLRVPGSLVAGALMAPVLAWVCYRVYRCEQRRSMTYPLLLWVVAVGSYVPDIANDYSLVLLPLAAVGVYSRRDSPIVHAAMALFFLSMQPIALPIHGYLLLLFKVAGVVAVGAMLVRRARELGLVTSHPPTPTGVLPRGQVPEIPHAARSPETGTGGGTPPPEDATGSREDRKVDFGFTPNRCFPALSRRYPPMLLPHSDCRATSL